MSDKSLLFKVSLLTFAIEQSDKNSRKINWGSLTSQVSSLIRLSIVPADSTLRDTQNLIWKFFNKLFEYSVFSQMLPKYGTILDDEIFWYKIGMEKSKSFSVSHQDIIIQIHSRINKIYKIHRIKANKQTKKTRRVKL